MSSVTMSSGGEIGRQFDAWYKSNRETVAARKHEPVKPNNPLAEAIESLNPDGYAAFAKRVDEIYTEFGFTSDKPRPFLILGKNSSVSSGNGMSEAFMIGDMHYERKAEMEEALNNDATIKAILANPDNHGKVAEKGGFFVTNGRDSAKFSEEAMTRSRERGNNGGDAPPPVDTVEEPADAVDTSEAPASAQSSKEEDAAAGKNIAAEVSKQLSEALKQENKSALNSSAGIAPIDIAVDESGMISASVLPSDPNSRFITDMFDALNKRLQEDMEKMRNGEDPSDPLSGMVFDLISV